MPVGVPPLNDAFRMGASVNYKEFGPVPLIQGHSPDSIPMEGSGHIYGFAIGHDGNQNRRFAIISPSVIRSFRFSLPPSIAYGREMAHR